MERTTGTATAANIKPILKQFDSTTVDGIAQIWYTRMIGIIKIVVSIKHKKWHNKKQWHQIRFVYLKQFKMISIYIFYSIYISLFKYKLQM